MYQKYKECKIVQVKKKIDETNVAFALQKNSPFLGIFNDAMTKLREGGNLAKILSPMKIQPQVITFRMHSNDKHLIFDKGKLF